MKLIFRLVTFVFSDLETVANYSLPVMLKKRGNNITFDPAGQNVLTFNFSIPENKTISLFITPLSNISVIKLLVIENDTKPTSSEVWTSGILFPAERDVYRNFSQLTLSDYVKGQGQNPWSILFTFNSSGWVNYTGELYAGISLDINDAETTDWLRQEDPDCLGNDLEVRCDAVVKISFEIETRVLECVYWNTSLQAFSRDGCEVMYTDRTMTSFP